MMQNLIELGGRLVRSPDDCQHQPLRCEAASALKDTHYEIKRLQEQDEVHWKTRRSLLCEIERLRAEVEALESERKPHTQLCAELIQLKMERVREAKKKAR